MSRVFLKTEDGKETEHWVEFKDYQRMPARLFMKFVNVSQNFSEHGDELFHILGKYVKDWYLEDSEGTKIPSPSEGDTWMDMITFDDLRGLIEAFSSMFPDAPR